MAKSLSAMWETQVQSLGQENPLEREMATHSCILACKIPQTGSWQATVHGVVKSRTHDWATNTHTHTHTHTQNAKFLNFDVQTACSLVANLYIAWLSLLPSRSSFLRATEVVSPGTQSPKQSHQIKYRSTFRLWLYVLVDKGHFNLSNCWRSYFSM